ncbi:MAG TPA: hypothetical protein VGM03_13275 [Phycisphaerae bacterium]|jgi:hypothetical protein
MSSKDFAIGVLSTTAVILLVGLILVHQMPAPAQASGMAGWSREYTYYAAVGRLQPNEEQLYVIDASAQLMNVYTYDINARAISLLQSVPLDKMRESAIPEARGGKAHGRPRP